MSLRGPIIFSMTLALMAGASFAQPAPQPDIATLQKAITIIQTQRNQALDAHAGSELRAATLAEENARLKAQVQAMEAKLPKPEPDDKKP